MAESKFMQEMDKAMRADSSEMKRDNYTGRPWITWTDTGDNDEGIMHDAARPYAVVRLRREVQDGVQRFHCLEVISRHTSLDYCASKAKRLQRGE